MTRMTSILPVLALALAPLAGCDDQQSDSDTVQVRGRTSNCSTPVVVSSGGSFSWGGIPWDDDPVGPLPFQEQMRIVQNSSSVMVANFETSEAAGACFTACRRMDMGWEGEGCVVEQTYRFGDAEAIKDERGELGYRVEVDADVSIGCACGG